MVILDCCVEDKELECVMFGQGRLLLEEGSREEIKEGRRPPEEVRVSIPHHPVSFCKVRIFSGYFLIIVSGLNFHLNKYWFDVASLRTFVLCNRNYKSS